MAKRRFIDSRIFPYHITARANNREIFPGDLRYIWKTFNSELCLLGKSHSIRVHAFLLMPNHFHLVLTSPCRPAFDPLMRFLSASTRIINAKYVRWGRIFGAPYHWSLIEDALYYAHVIKYVYRNPVKAKLCGAVENYPFSTVCIPDSGGEYGLQLSRPLKNLDRLIPSSAHYLLWLNKPHRGEENQAIKKALRRRKFEIPVNRSDRKLIRLSNPA